MSEESIKPPTTSNYSLATGTIFFNGAKIKGEINRGCMKQEKKTTFHHEYIVNVHVIYEMNLRLNDLDSKFTLSNYLFGAVKLTNALYLILYYNMVLDLKCMELFHCHMVAGLVKM